MVNETKRKPKLATENNHHKLWKTRFFCIISLNIQLALILTRWTEIKCIDLAAFFSSNLNYIHMQIDLNQKKNRKTKSI